MDSILEAYHAFRESDCYSLWLPYLRLGAMFIIGFVVGLGTVVAESEVMAKALMAVRQALRDIGIADKQAADLLGVNLGNLSDKLRGERALTVESLSKFPVEFWQALPVRLAMTFGMSTQVRVGLALHSQSQSKERVA